MLIWQWVPSNFKMHRTTARSLGVWLARDNTIRKRITSPPLLLSPSGGRSSASAMRSAPSRDCPSNTDAKNGRDIIKTDALICQRADPTGVSLRDDLDKVFLLLMGKGVSAALYYLGCWVSIKYIFMVLRELLSYGFWLGLSISVFLWWLSFNIRYFKNYCNCFIIFISFLFLFFLTLPVTDIAVIVILIIIIPNIALFMITFFFFTFINWGISNYGQTRVLVCK